MRDQYVGDVSDVIKCSLLRALAGQDRRLGIAWYYVPGDDGRPDGRYREWRDEPAWRGLDREVHEALSRLSERTVAALERAPIWPAETLFHGIPVARKRERESWSAGKRTHLEAADLIFLDPDNGLGTTLKHATSDELRSLNRQGRSMVFISFPSMNKPHDDQVAFLHERLIREANAREVLTLRTSVSVPRSRESPYFVPRSRWFTIVDPDQNLIQRITAFSQALAAIPRVKVRLDPVVGDL